MSNNSDILHAWKSRIAVLGAFIAAMFLALSMTACGSTETETINNELNDDGSAITLNTSNDEVVEEDAEEADAE